MRRRTSAFAVTAILALLVSGCSIIGRFRSATSDEALMREAERLSPSTGSPVPDGRVILVKKGNTLGALILRDQTVAGTGDSVRYNYYYRSDGKGAFSASEASRYKHGTGVVSKPESPPVRWLLIRFGPFAVRWSPHMTGSGWISYDHIRGERVAPGDLRISVTSETDINRVDAADSRWIYKGSPSDPGVTATARK